MESGNILSVFTIILAAAGPMASAQNASFDCAKARSSIEKNICADVELSRVDAEMGELYAAAIKTRQSEEVKRS